MPVGLHAAGVPPIPLKVTVLAFCVAPKFVPVIVIELPIVAEEVDKLATSGACKTVKNPELLDCPLTVTNTLPLVAPVGTVTTMLFALQLVGIPAAPLNVTVLVPCVDPKLRPVTVTEEPTTPDAGDKHLTTGACDTLNGIPLLASPPTMTTTFPDAAAVGTGATMLVALQ
jgi:hypothetical protein